jgi:TPP-dependent pyruvate/acetoin dehydrogenase alpha subunit
LAAIDDEAQRQIDEAYEFAEASPYPDTSEAVTDMYSMMNERCVQR